MADINNLKPIQTLKPFTRFCSTIGNLPTSYMVSLTYEEQLLWLCNYLENTVIPAVNQNGEAVTELQNLYNQLKLYVDNYFTNLDVQEEINNKLDEMAQEGLFQEIIVAYLNTKAIFGYNSVSDMKNATNLINGSYARTLGYYTANDAGSGLYQITNIQDENVPQEQLNNGLYATLIYNKSVIVEQLGAYGDGIHDDTEILNKCLLLGNVIGNKKYLLNGEINCNNNNLNLKQITGTPIFTNNTNSLNPVDIHIDKADNITLENFKNSNFYIGYAITVNITVNDTEGSSFAYNTLSGGQWTNVYIYGNSTRAWINENTFQNIRIVKNLSIIGTGYPHNNNKFYDISVEDSTTITLTYTYCNYFSYRGETLPTFNISNDRFTYGNVFFRNWSSAKGLFINQEEKIENQNMFIYADFSYLNNYIMYNATTNESGEIPLTAYTTLQTIYIDPSSEGAVRFNSDSPTFRIRVTPLKADGTLFNENPNAISSSNIVWNSQNKYYTRVVNSNNGYFSILNNNPEVAKLKLEIYNYAAGTAHYATAELCTLRPKFSVVNVLE